MGKRGSVIMEGLATPQFAEDDFASKVTATVRATTPLQRMDEDNLGYELISSLLLRECLASDPRPSFMIDLAATTQNLLEPCFCNIALLQDQPLLDAITGTTVGTDQVCAFTEFYDWAEGPRVGGALTFHKHVWTQNTVQNRWRLIQGMPRSWLHTPQSPRNDILTPSEKGDATSQILDKNPKIVVVGRSDAHRQLPDQSRCRLETAWIKADHASEVAYGSRHYDCTAPGAVSSTAYTEFMRTVDWTQTSLGPIDTWDPQLRTMVNVVMNDPLPAILYIGPEYIMIYNEPFVPLMHKYHPAVFATSAPVTQREYWKSFEGIIEHNVTTGKAVMHNHLQLFVHRNGMLEETYFSFSFLPVVGTDGQIIAHYEPINETTREVISQRRMSTLLNAGQETAVVRDQTAFWDLVLKCLHSNEKDVPFALTYSVSDGQDATPSPGIGANPMNLPVTARQCLLRGSVGLPKDHHAAHSMLDFQHGDGGWAPFFRSALAAGHPVVFHQEDHRQLRELLRGIQSSAFGDRITSVVVSPITPTAYENILAFLVIGVNPRTPYNEDYQQFIKVASRLIETSLASVVLLEEEVRTRERMALQAAEVQQKLAAQLKTSEWEVERREQKFQRFAEKADVGIFVLDPSGDYTYRNPAWYEIFQPAAKDVNVRNAWLTLVEPEDVQRCEGLFKQLYETKESISFELRLKRSWAAPHDMQDPNLVTDSRTWILCSAYPELTETGEVAEILGCVTDVSRQKFGEGLQMQKTALALESKRRLENFIDTTSHEMRNPLTAIIQCADGIIQSHIALLQTTGDAVSVTLDALETSLDGAQTIVQCAQHQKRIVDDILTMSKLDSDLLTITPVQMEPQELAARSVKMLESEAKAADVDMRFEVEESYKLLEVGSVMLDPTRLLQVLINLITNAIKFTRLEDVRHVIVSIGASLLEQPNNENGVQYIRQLQPRTTSDRRTPEADGQESVFVHFTVKDTGRGLSSEEKDLIFSRFSQASPKTHIHYGGSGLGLFISRRLVEMQGGSIGFASERKAGSIFSFYVKAPRVALGDLQESPLEALRSRVKATNPKPYELESAMPQIAEMLHRPPRPVESSSTEPDYEQSHQQVNEHRPYSDSILPTPHFRLARSDTKRSPEDRSVEESPTDSPNPISPSRRPLHVLVVEDNLVNQRVLAKQLTGLGCVVGVANHGAEALQYLAQTCVWKGMADKQVRNLDVVLMDWEMPVMDGLTCVKNIRDLQRDGSVTAHVPIVGVTANARPEQLGQAMAAGMDDVVTKPFRVQEVMVRMEALMARLGPDG